MVKVTVSAPGKLHLSGEHAVVYGNPAVLVSTSNRTFVTLEHNDAASPTDHISTVRQKNIFLDVICKIFEKHYGMEIPSVLALTISSDIPTGSGMGSSAAIAVAFLGACVTYFDKPWDAQRINELAYQAEKSMHGNPSGSDPAIVTHGGILWYRKELDFLKTFWLLPFKIPKTFAPFVLINTGRVESTGDLVQNVAAQRAQDKKLFTVRLDEIEQITKSMVQAIHDEKEDDFCASIKHNQRLLESLGVVSKSAHMLVSEVEKAGGVAKISGAGGTKGGSGVVIAMHNKPAQMIALAKQYNYPAFQVQLGGEGIRKEQVIA